MKTTVALFALLAASTLLGGCSYVFDGSWERCSCPPQYVNPCPKFPATERPWNYPWEPCTNSLAFRP